jgi:hypothetical protein
VSREPGTSNGGKADAERKTQPAIARPALCRYGASTGRRHLRNHRADPEEDDTVLRMEQHALAPFEIADHLYLPEFGKLNMPGDAPKLLDESFVTAANLEGHSVKAIVYDVVGAPAVVRDVADPDCPAAASPPRSVPSPRSRRVEPEDWAVVFRLRWCRAFGDHDRPGLGARVIGVDLSSAARARAAELGAVAIDPGRRPPPLPS